MLAPKGCAFLFTAKERQSDLDPLVVSWGYESAAPSHSIYLDYHEGQGTRDYSAFLTVPHAIRFMHENRWEEVAARCRALVTSNAERFCGMLNTRPLAPLTGEFIVQMLSLRVSCSDPESTQQKLFTKYGIEVPLMRHGEAVYLRFSVNGFNSGNDLDKLHDAVKDLIKRGELIA
jgi:isopenicillin-N epimerase